MSHVTVSLEEGGEVMGGGVREKEEEDWSSLFSEAVGLREVVSGHLGGGQNQLTVGPGRRPWKTSCQ